MSTVVEELVVLDGREETGGTAGPDSTRPAPVADTRVRRRLPRWAPGGGISPRLLADELVRAGFVRLTLGTKRTSNAILFHRTENVLKEVDAAYVRGHLLDEVRRLNYGDDLLDGVYNLKKQVLDHILHNLPRYSYGGVVPGTSVLTMMADTADRILFPFANGVVVVTADDVSLQALDAYPGALWESAILSHTISLEPPDTPVKGRAETFYERAFMERVRVGSDPWTEDYDWNDASEQRFRAFCTAVGYLLHRYRDPANPRAVILVDTDSYSSEANGGTGKSLVLRLLQQAREVSIQDGKRFLNAGSFGGRFQMTTVNADTSIIGIDDAGAGFRFDCLFAMIAGNLEVEHKGKDRIVIPAAQAPKFAVTTNAMLPVAGTSFQRRMWVIEFGSYWADGTRHGEQPTDPQHLGGPLFAPHEAEEERNRTFNFLFRCAQRWLREGVVEAPSASYSLNAFRAAFGPDFVEYFTNHFDTLPDRQLDPERGEFLDELFAAFSAACPRHGCRQADFPTRLMRLGDHFGWEYNPHKAGKGTTPTDRRWRVLDRKTGEKRPAVRWSRTRQAIPDAELAGGHTGDDVQPGTAGMALRPGSSGTAHITTAGVTGATGGSPSEPATSQADGTELVPAGSATDGRPDLGLGVVESPAVPDDTVDTADTRVGVAGVISVSQSEDISERISYEPWSEKYRPRTVSECILPARVKDPLEEKVRQGLVKTNLLLTGSPGTGKTSVARAICDQLGADTLFVCVAEQHGVELVRDTITPFAYTCSLSDRRKIAILDEADYFTPDAQAMLRGVMNRATSNCLFIFTANDMKKITAPLGSRCTHQVFAFLDEEREDMVRNFADRMKHILAAEGVTYDSAVLMAFINKYYPDFRRTLNELEGAVVNNTLSAAGLSGLQVVA